MRKLAFALVAALVAGLGTLAPAAAPVVNAATQPKVAIIVGATHSATAKYRSYANEVYNEAVKFTSNVVKVYSPSATWSKVKSAVNGASIIVYLGHGNGWPSPYTYDANYTTKDGFGLNYDNNGDGKLSDYENRYYGEPSIRTLTPAKNAVVLLFHLCYASGNSEPGQAEPSLSTAKQRVDNYAAAFIKAGARAVIANGHSHNPYYINALFTTRQTMDEYWRNAPDFNGDVRTYESTRNPGYTYQLDREGVGKYYRSIAGKMTLTTQDVTGAAYASTSADPTTWVVPGNASVTADAAPVYGSAESAGLGVDPVRTLPLDARVRLDEQAWGAAWDGSPIFRMHTDSGVEGWMTGTHLRPRDIAAPRIWDMDDGAGVFSPNDDGSQDEWDLTLELSEPSAWTIRVLDDEGSSVASRGGTGDVAALTWDPGNRVADGTYTWQLEAVDDWGNGPLVEDGPVVVDTQAPDLSLADADSDNVPLFTPNGDGSRETISLSASSTEPGSVVADVVDADGDVVDRLSGTVTGSSVTMTWDGKGDDGVVPDGRYTLVVVARDRAGNESEPQTRAVDVYGSLGHVASSRSIFYPQDGDNLAMTTTFSMRLASPATVTWAVINAEGTVVRTFRADEAMDAGTHKQSWDGRDDAGAFVPRGTYRTLVTATDGTLGASQSASVMTEAFRIKLSDTTPRRGQKITVTVTSPEILSAAPRVAFYQPGIGGWAVTAKRISTYSYRVTVTLRSSGTGTMRVKAYGWDSGGRKQLTNTYFPLH